MTNSKIIEVGSSQSRERKRLLTLVWRRDDANNFFSYISYKTRTYNVSYEYA